MDRARTRHSRITFLTAFWGFIFALLSIGLGGVAPRRAEGADPTPGGTLVIALDQEPPTLDPHASPSAVTYQVIASVKFNFDRIVDPNFKAGTSRAQLAGYAESTVIDEYTVQVSFKAPNAPFLTYAGAGTLSFVSPKAVKEMGDQVHTQPVGTGSFMVKEYVAKDHTTMVRNPGYTRKAPWSDRAGPAYLDAVVWKFVPEAGTRVTTLESGETQGIYLVPSQALPRLEKDSNFRVEKLPWPGAPRIWMLNTTKPPLDDLRVRQAINYAVDKDAFLATVYKGTAVRAAAPLTGVMLDDPAVRQSYPFDQAKAKALLDEASWQPGPD